MNRTINNVNRRGTWVLAAALVAVTASLATVGSSTAQVGGAGVVFLKIEPDSRAAGMGNAGVALADNASAMFWNPAGLGFQTGTEAGITHSNWLPEFSSDLFYEYLVAKHHLPGVGTLGAHVTFLNLGRHEGRDQNNISTGEFRSYDMAIGVSYGRKITSTLGLGTSVRFIYSNLAPGQVIDGLQETKAGVSTAVDLALLFRSKPFNLGSVPTTLSAGFNLANMGPKIKYSDNDDEADPIPTNLRFGTALTFDFDEFNALNFVIDFNKDLIDVDSTGAAPFYEAIFSSWGGIDVNLNTSDPTDIERVGVLRQITIGTGMEYWYDRLLALRFGYFYEDPYNGNREFLTLGAGIRYNIIGVDFSYIYALEEGSPLANTMRFSLLLNFAG